MGTLIAMAVILQANSSCKWEISHQCPYLLRFSFLYSEGRETGGPDGDEMVACGHPTCAVVQCMSDNKTFHTHTFIPKSLKKYK